MSSALPSESSLIPTSSKPPSSSCAKPPASWLDGCFADLWVPIQREKKQSVAPHQRTVHPEVDLDDFLAFGVTYFPHYCSLPPAEFHAEFAAYVNEILKSPNSERLAIAAPRGYAKSTWFSLILPIYCIVRGLKRFIVLISDTATQANALLGEIRYELEENEALIADFPHATGCGPKWTEDEIVTANDRKVLALGTGKRIRGRRWRHYRPDLFVIDDLENDENTRNPDQRDKVDSWLKKAVLKAKGIAQKCDILIGGTLIHFDSVLARLVDQKKNPGWRSKIYRAVIQEAKRADLWDTWQTIYTDWSMVTEERQARALAFYKANESAMLDGVVTLWPQGETYYELMCLRIDEGVDSFNSEKQNNPIDPSKCSFPESWFQWFDEVEIEGQVWLIPEQGSRIALADCDIFGALDPSMGKLDKGRDPCAIGSMAAYPSTRLTGASREYQSYWMLDALVAHLHPHEQMQTIFEWHRHRHYERFGVEAVQFQELFADDVQKAILDDRTLQGLSIRKLNPLTDKVLRIMRTSPFIHFGRLKFSRKCVGTYYDQYRFYGQAKHDDGPDMTEMCLETLGAIGWTLVDVDMGAGSRDDLHPNPDVRQVENRIPQLVDHRLSEYRRCGTCMNFQEVAGMSGKGVCGVTRFVVAPDTVECEHYGDKE